MKRNTNSKEFSDEFNPISFREERKRTGRYVAVGLAICITMLGLHQAVVQHTPVIAGLFAPAIIMFLYVFWVLFTASKVQRKHQLTDEESQFKEEENNEENKEPDEKIEQFLDHCECALTEVNVNFIANEKEQILKKDVNILPKEDNILAEKFSKNKLNRTYSIA